MPILTQTFFPFVCSHLMSLTLLSAWHIVVNLILILLFYVGFYLVNKGFCRFE